MRRWWSRSKEKQKVLSDEDVKAIIAQEREAEQARINALCDEIVAKALNSLHNGHFVHDSKGLRVEVKCKQILSYDNERQVENILREHGYSCSTDESWKTMYVWFN